MGELFLVIGIVFVLSCLPALFSFFRARARFSGKLIVTCPETDRAATIQLKAGHAARTSLTGETDLRVKSCNRWSGPRGQCHQGCLSDTNGLILGHAKSA